MAKRRRSGVCATASRGSVRLNAAQERAAAHLHGPMLVLAGPGTGKTAVITERTCRLVREAGVPADRILVVTFTRAAAGEMRTRIQKRLGAESAGLSIGTFHGIFYGILRTECRLPAGSILGGAKRRRLLEELINTSSPGAERDPALPEQVGREISLLKNRDPRGRAEVADLVNGVLPAAVFRQVFRQYETYLAENGRLDFDDIILRCRQLLAERPEVRKRWQQKFRYILVDEFQDIAPSQYDVIRMLAKPENNLFIVGDDDQSVYRFRGADPGLMLGFRSQYADAKTVTLDTNYRCTEPILRLSQRVIAHNRRRFGKDLHAKRGDGAPVFVQSFRDAGEEAAYIAREIRRCEQEGISPEETAVLFRTNEGCRRVVEQLLTLQIPFHAAEAVPCVYDHWIAGQLAAYMELGAGGRRRSDFLKICNRPNRYLSRDAFPRETVSFRELYDAYRGKDWMCARLCKLEEDLHMIGSLPPYGAIQYIQLAVGYGAWLEEYARAHALETGLLTGVLEELKESAKPCRTFGEWKLQMERTREALRKERPTGGTTVSTLHASKGCEYRAVFIADLNEGIIPWRGAEEPAELEEERRMLYVGMTRARDRLYLCSVRRRHEKAMQPSRFLSGISDM